MQFAEDTGVIGVVVGVVVGLVGFVGGIAGGVDSGGAGEGVDFEAGVVGQDDFSGDGTAVLFGFLAGVGFEGFAVFD